jgi:hypothetical protein
MHYEEDGMCQSKNAASLSDTDQEPTLASSLPEEVHEALDAAETLYRAIEEHAPAASLPREVTQPWKRLGECLAWLQR